jgi:D-arabinose 1-dehydrogenase-like Zn-dependent alcohol dehydrogenase
MKAYRVQQFGKPMAEEVLPDPTPVEKQVIVKVHACGLCHTDLHFHEGHINLGGGAHLPLEAAGANLPLTLGHEIYGHILDYGPKAGLAEEDRGRPVIVYPWIGCGECEACRNGLDNACLAPQSDHQNLGLQRPGGFGEKVVVRDPRFLVDAQGVDPSAGGIYACAGLTSYSALKKVPNRTGWTAIIGMGGVGLMGLAVAKGIGFEKVLAIDINDERLTLAETEYGADLVANSRNADITSAILKKTGGINAVVDFVGSEQTSALALGLLSRGGTYVNVGLFGGELRIPLAALTLRQLAIHGSFVGTLTEMRELIDYVRAGKIKPIPIATAPIGSLNDRLAELLAGKIQGRQVLVHDAHSTQIGERPRLQHPTVLTTVPSKVRQLA